MSSVLNSGGYPLRVEYDLTPAGLKLVPLLDALGSWWDATEAVSRSQGGALPVEATGPSKGTFFD